MTLLDHVERLSTDQAVLLEDIDLQVAAGDIHTVMGASGSDKSSLLAAICGTLPAGLHFDGSVSLQAMRIDGLPTEWRRVGILFQDDLLFVQMGQVRGSYRKRMDRAKPRSDPLVGRARAIACLS